MRRRDVRDSHSHSRGSTVSLPLKPLLHKGFISFTILYKLPLRPINNVNEPTKMYKTIILPVVLYGCEAWSLTLREECRLRVFENRIPM
jgi:hypothetical protein